MKRLHPLHLLILHTTTTSAWTFTWRNASSSSFLKNSHDPLPCTSIDQAKGQEFDFHPESDNYNFYIWATENCTGDYAGYTTPDIWRKKASRDMRSYLVDYGDGKGPMSTPLATASATATSTSSASTGSTTTTSSSTGTDAPSASTTSTPETTASASNSPDSDSGTTISGGAIAGIVIAIVAGLSILGAGFFYLGRRARRGTNPPSNGSNPSYSQSQPQLQNMYPPASSSSIPPSSSHGAGGGGGSAFGGTGAAQYQQSHGSMQQQQQQQQSMHYYGESSPLAHTHSSTQASQKAWVELPGEDMASELSGSRQVNELEGHTKTMYQ